jgi:transcription antitermination protein NusB
MSRKKAREAAVMLLYHWDMMGFNSENINATIGETIDSADSKDILNMTLTPDDRAYISAILESIQEHISIIDSSIETETTGWKLSRLPKVDLAILRLGVGEMLFYEDIPYAVTINECVDLAKHYSTENSGAFINGVLSTILKKNGNVPCPSSE